MIRKQPWITSVPAVPSASEVGMPFRMTLRARGGSGAFAWELTDGRPPAGLRLGRDGSIEGTPRFAGTFRFVARARDTEARVVTWPVELVVAPRLGIATTRVPAATVGDRYRAGLDPAGGVAPRTWRLVGGHLPPGVRLARGLGLLAGTPRKAGVFRFAAEVTDRLDASFLRWFTVTVRRAAVRAELGG